MSGLPIKSVRLPDGESVPALGLGTWNIGDDARTRAEEIATIRVGIDLGMTLIDTAEMYGEGKSEELVGEAVEGVRDRTFLVSKVYPHNASRKGAVAACERSLRRLRTDRIDLYLLHWRGSVPLAETMETFAALQKAGKIRHYGVSNFDVRDMDDLWKFPAGKSVAANQVLYNLTRRGIERGVLPWLRERHIPTMAYSPIEQARLLQNSKLASFAQKHGLTPAQAALAWLLRSDDMIVIPKTGNRERLRENHEALSVTLTASQLDELDKLFSAPQKPVPLDML